MTASITRDLIIEKLSTVYDPEIPVNIWGIGVDIRYRISKAFRSYHSHDPYGSRMPDCR